ncbi:uncharacterized protein PAC_18380 [Phialocephala subalpina]|uniref:Uncharacterized protein n=1 Tax=Phialocephala subalpina TaxID=576137 RepID=A0A1L7XTX2_9HELO|nr:uncharacterized protein PAC_18380 [Phialocephala subalpina]
MLNLRMPLTTLANTQSSQHIPTPFNMDQNAECSSHPQSSDEIINKMQKFVAGQCPFKTPPPLPHFSWASIDVLEASLLISVVATSTKLQEAITSTSDGDQHLLALTNSCMKRYLEIMEPAQVCCKALNIVRTGNIQGDTTSLEAALKALKHVKEEQNPILTDFVGGVEEMRKWILSCRTYVENVVAMMEYASGQLKAAGFA